MGGPILPACERTVLIGNQPAARVGDLLRCSAPSDRIKMGEPSVLIGYQQAARLGDPTSHGGVIVQGEPTVLIGTVSQGAALRAAARAGVPFCEACEAARARMSSAPGQ